MRKNGRGVILLATLALAFQVTEKSASAASQPKSVIIDGVEYIPKKSQQGKMVAKETLASAEVEQKPAAAPAEEPSSAGMKGKAAAGIDISVVNLGIGPSAEYWITDNIVAYAHAGLGTFTSYGAEIQYVFDKEVKLYRTYAARPYLGIGYSAIKGPKASVDSVSADIKGSGADFHAGLFMPAEYITQNVALRLDAAYSTASLDTTVTVFGKSQNVSSNYNQFGVGMGIYYFFK